MLIMMGLPVIVKNGKILIDVVDRKSQLVDRCSYWEEIIQSLKCATSYRMAILDQNIQATKASVFGTGAAYNMSTKIMWSTLYFDIGSLRLDSNDTHHQNNIKNNIHWPLWEIQIFEQKDSFICTFLKYRHMDLECHVEKSEKFLRRMKSWLI